MFLDDIRLVPHTKDRALSTRLMDCWRHVEDIVRALRPADWDVGGIGKLICMLELDQRVEREGLVSPAVWQVRLTGFDGAAFLAMPEDAQDERALQLLATGLRTLCARHGVDSGPVERLVAAVQATQFRHMQPMKELGRWNAAHTVHGEVLVLYQRSGTDVTVRLTPRGGEPQEHLLLLGELWATVWFRCCQSRWDDDAFVVLDRSGEETARLRAAP